MMDYKVINSSVYFWNNCSSLGLIVFLSCFYTHKYIRYIVQPAIQTYDFFRGSVYSCLEQGLIL